MENIILTQNRGFKDQKKFPFGGSKKDHDENHLAQMQYDRNGQLYDIRYKT